jgi:saccharopine dehydrogenase-like NADP-dependent oxidoreductase
VLISPRRLTEKVLAPQLRPGPGDADMVLLDVTAHGIRDGRPTTLHARVTDFYDPATTLSAMARVTGFTLAAATGLLAAGAVRGSGWQIPHLALRDGLRQQFLRSLTGHGIQWSEPQLSVST